MTKRIGSEQERHAIVGLGYFAWRMIAACKETGVRLMIDAEDTSI